MQLEPAPPNCMLDAGAEFRPGGLERVEKRSIELFDVNATVLDSFNGLRELDQFARGGFGSGKGTLGGEVHPDRLPDSSSQGRTASTTLVVLGVEPGPIAGHLFDVVVDGLHQLLAIRAAVPSAEDEVVAKPPSSARSAAIASARTSSAR